jgi:hypothetical protein
MQIQAIAAPLDANRGGNFIYKREAKVRFGIRRRPAVRASLGSKPHDFIGVCNICVLGYPQFKN